MPSKKQRAKAATAVKAEARATAATVVAPTKAPRTLAQVARAEERANMRKVGRTGLSMVRCDINEGLWMNAGLRRVRITNGNRGTEVVRATAGI